MNKPGKIRLVFDIAAKTSGVSLNDQLETGPNLLKSLPRVLIWFRRFVIDISDMFLRFQIREIDRSTQRFLWRDKDRKQTPL